MVAAGKDPRALAGSVRKVLELINNVCFDISMESGTAEGRKMSNLWRQVSTVGRLATSWTRGTSPVLLAPFSASQNVCISGTFVNHVK